VAKNISSILILLVGRLAFGIGSFAYVRFMTEWVDPSQLGRFYYTIAIGSWGAMALVNPIVMYVNKSCIQWREDTTGQEKFLGVVIYWAIAGFFYIGVVSLYWFGFAKEASLGWLFAAVLAPLISFSDAFVTMTFSVLNFMGRRGLFSFLTNLSIWSKIICLAIVIALFSESAESVLFSQVLPLIFLAPFGFFLIWRIYHKTSPLRSSFFQKEVWRFCWPIALAQIFWWGQLQGFRIPLGMLGGDVSVGVFSVMFGVAVGIWGVFDSVFMQFYAPIFWEQVTIEGAERADLNLYVQKQLPFLIIFAFWIISIAPFLPGLVLAKKYSIYCDLFILISIAEGLRISGSGYSYAINAVNKNTVFIVPAIVSFTIAILGTYVAGFVWAPVIGTAVALTQQCRSGIVIFFLTTVPLPKQPFVFSASLLV